MPSIRATGISEDAGLKARVTSNSGRTVITGCEPAPRVSVASTVGSSPETSSMPMPVMPPNIAGVSGRPEASITVAPDGAARPVPTAAMRPLRTRTSVARKVPASVAVCTVALRSSRSCAAALPAKASRPAAAMASSFMEPGRFIAHLPWPAVQAPPAPA